MGAYVHYLCYRSSADERFVIQAIENARQLADPGGQWALLFFAGGSVGGRAL